MTALTKRLSASSDGPTDGPIGFSDDPLLLLHYTAFCNASCAHCIVESGPRRKERMAFDLASELIEGAVGVPDLRMVVFSGGESFIYLDDVLKLCALAHQHGLLTRVISNGFWARTPELATATLEQLSDSCVDQIVISFGEFHRQYIPADRVRNVFLGAQAARRAPLVAYSTVNGGLRDGQSVAVAGVTWPRAVLKDLDDYGFSPEECVPLHDAVAQAAALEGDARVAYQHAMVHARALINWEPLAFGGRATKLLSDRAQLKPLTEDAGPPCAAVGRQITAVTSGHVYPCCSVWTNFPEHAIGVVRGSGDLAAVVAEAASDPLVQFIHQQGPGPLLAQLRTSGEPLPGAYSDICQMCQTLFERYSLDELRDVARGLSVRGAAAPPAMYSGSGQRVSHSGGIA